jgi:hypothetical protein
MGVLTTGSTFWLIAPEAGGVLHVARPFEARQLPALSGPESGITQLGDPT